MKLIQWNIRSLRANFQHFKKFINIHFPDVIAIQETRINTNNCRQINWSIPGYNFYNNRDKINLSGCGIYIKNTIIHREKTLNTDLDCTAIEIVNRNEKITIVSIYLKPVVRIKYNKIQSIINQINQPFIIMGNLNSHNTLWGSNHIDARGKIIQEIIENNSIDLQNTGSPTYFSATHQTHTCIDITLTSHIQGSIQWKVMANREFSDHYPTMMQADINSTKITLKTPKWNFKKANWDKFREITDDIGDIENINIGNIQDRLIQAATQTIPLTRNSEFSKKAVPF